jgi:hypothetical protein
VARPEGDHLVGGARQPGELGRRAAVPWILPPSRRIPALFVCSPSPRLRHRRRRRLDALDAGLPSEHALARAFARRMAAATR